MLAYTAADSLNAITRTYGVGSQPAIVDRLKLATDSGSSPSTLHALYRRVIQHFTSTHRS
jgi:hypothetical protein